MPVKVQSECDRKMNGAQTREEKKLIETHAKWERIRVYCLIILLTLHKLYLQRRLQTCIIRLIFLFFYFILCVLSFYEFRHSHNTMTTKKKKENTTNTHIFLIFIDVFVEYIRISNRITHTYTQTMPFHSLQCWKSIVDTVRSPEWKTPAVSMYACGRVYVFDFHFFAHHTLCDGIWHNNNNKKMRLEIVIVCVCACVINVYRTGIMLHIILSVKYVHNIEFVFIAMLSR